LRKKSTRGIVIAQIFVLAHYANIFVIEKWAIEILFDCEKAANIAKRIAVLIGMSVEQFRCLF
jgi:hypothetical protein